MSSLDDILESEEIREDKAAYRTRTFVHLHKSLSLLQEYEDLAFTDAEVGKYYTWLVLQNRSYWLSRTDESFIMNENASRGERKKFQDEIRNMAVLYMEHLFWGNKEVSKEDIMEEAQIRSAEELTSEDIDEGRPKQGTIEYALADALNNEANFADIGRAVLEGANRYLKRERPGKKKENLFVEYRTIYEELEKLAES